VEELLSLACNSFIASVTPSLLRENFGGDPDFNISPFFINVDMELHAV
jgi:hypothetical protein